MPTDAKNYSPETRAVKLATKDVRSVVQSFRDSGQPDFMQKRTSSRSERLGELIRSSPVATQLMTEGRYPLQWLARVARADLNRAKLRNFGDQEVGDARTP